MDILSDHDFSNHVGINFEISVQSCAFGSRCETFRHFGTWPVDHRHEMKFYLCLGTAISKNIEVFSGKTITRFYNKVYGEYSFELSQNVHEST